MRSRPPLSNLKSVKPRAHSTSQQATCNDDDMKALQKMSFFADGTVCYPGNQNVAGSNASRAVSTPFSCANPALPPLLCSAIRQESIGYETRHETQMSSYDMKDLSPIEENSDEDKSGLSQTNPLNPWRNLSESENREPALYKTTNRSQSCTSSSQYAAATNAVPVDASTTKLGRAGSVTNAAAVVNASLNSSGDSRLKNVPDMKFLAKAMRTIDFGKYNNFRECPGNLTEKFSVKSTVTLGTFSSVRIIPFYSLFWFQLTDAPGGNLK